MGHGWSHDADASAIDKHHALPRYYLAAGKQQFVSIIVDYGLVQEDDSRVETAG